ncbi:MAG: hypothetical protein IKO68_06130 [Oscillospiraceae bacterium]|nr:hypothetical protein [Oscillospiraceae bacterium]MBR6862983.1 hypothetical protein [Acidaminococcaceae bacterium]
MAKIIVTSRYIRNSPKQNAGNLVKYMGTREGVERVPSPEKPAPATVRQQRLIKDLLKADADAKNYLEYRDYENDPSKQNATEFIDAFIERNADRINEVDKLVKYMAERPGVEKLGPHGLFSQTDDRIDLDSVADEVGAHTGPVWTNVISLRREDAERLGYNNAQAWRDLVRRNVTDLAKAYQIDLDNLCWYGAYHDKSHHPHMHLLVYAKDGKQGWLSKRGIDEMHSFFGSDIFRFEQQKLFRMETELRNKLKDETGIELLKRVEEAKNMYQPTPESVILFQKLASRLKNLSGKKLYGYLPKDVKEIVDQLISDLAKSEGISQLYKEWNEVNREKLSLYREKKEPDLPLEENPVFRSIKNKIIMAALGLPLPAGYDPEQDAGRPVSEKELEYAARAAKMHEHFYPQNMAVPQVPQDITVPQVTEENEETEEAELARMLSAETVPMTYVFNSDYSSAVRVPTCMVSALTELARALAWMMGEEQNRRLMHLRGQVDRKLRSQIEEKKKAHGLKTDGSVQNYQDYDQEQSM